MRRASRGWDRADESRGAVCVRSRAARLWPGRHGRRALMFRAGLWCRRCVVPSPPMLTDVDECSRLLTVVRGWEVNIVAARLVRGRAALGDARVRPKGRTALIAARLFPISSRLSRAFAPRESPEKTGNAGVFSNPGFSGHFGDEGLSGLASNSPCRRGVDEDALRAATPRGGFETRPYAVRGANRSPSRCACRSSRAP